MKSKIIFKLLLSLTLAYLTTSQGTVPDTTPDTTSSTPTETSVGTASDTTAPADSTTAGTTPDTTTAPTDTTAGTTPNTTTTTPDTSVGTAPAAIAIVTGPVIGKVTTTTARVLIEFDAAVPITVILTDPNGTQFPTEKTVTANIPTPFAFEGLQPNTRYNVTLSDPSIAMVESYFTTLSGVSGKLNFATVSCMDKGIQLAKEPEADLWADLLRRVQAGEINYLLQIGDQVYMDDPTGNDDPAKPYFASMALLNSVPREEWDSQIPQILENLRNEFRSTWSIQSVKETLAKIPSLTIFDDHEVRDDWGYVTQDTDPTSPDYFYGNLARQVYYEYERQLREDIDFNNLSSINTEYYVEILNDIGFFFVDYRGIRTWNRNYSEMGTSQLGAKQTELIDEVFNPTGGTFANLSNAFFVSPLTLVFLVEKFTHIGYFSSNDVQESWTFAYGDELIALLSRLRNWKIAQAGRELTVLDGDVHMGGYTDIYYDRDFAFLQFTSSSIASSAPGDVVFQGFNLVKEVENLADPWTYEHHDWTNKFNYGIMLANLVDGQATSPCYRVQADADEEPEMVDDDGDKVDGSDWQDTLAGNT